MALAMSTALRNARSNQITTAMDAGASAGMTRVYDGVPPAPGGAATTLLAEMVHGDPSAPAAINGVRTANPINQDPSANAQGDATWYREVDSDGNFIMDGRVGLATDVPTPEMIVPSITVSIGLPFSITSHVLTEGNA